MSQSVPSSTKEQTTNVTTLQHNLDPFVRLVDVNSSGEAQRHSLKTTTASSNAPPTPTIALKSSLTVDRNVKNSAAAATSSVVASTGEFDTPLTPVTVPSVASGSSCEAAAEMDQLRDRGIGQPSLGGPLGPPSTPSIVKPRRPSVHFADSEPRIRSTASIKQEGGINRKHRSRKEKLVCRSENLSDMAMDSDVRGASLPSTSTPSTIGRSPPAPIPNITVAVPPPISLPSLSLKKGPSNKGRETSVAMKPPAVPASPKTSSAGLKMKSRVKKASNSVPSRGVSRKSASSSQSQGPFLMGGFKDSSPVKKKKVIEIVSPRKRKVDHMELMKTSSDPICIRAANKPSKTKKKPQNPYKFSRANLYKPRVQPDEPQRIGRASTSGSQQGSPSKAAGVAKRQTESEPPVFPQSFMDELTWLLKEAEKEFGSDRPGRGGKLGSLTSPSKGGSSIPGPSSAGSSSASRKLQFGRRRVESEPPTASGLGFEMTPGSPAHQSLYQFRKDIYFSPSPSYAAAAPAGRRRYSRRRHAKIHPPFDDSNCSFQGHHCQNPKVHGSQYCDKHLDSGPSSGYSHCRYIKDGRPCSNLIPTYDPNVTVFASERFCEVHANLTARAEYEQRNPKVKPDQAKNIISLLGRIYTEGFGKSEIDSFGTPCSNPDILQVLEEPDATLDLPLNSLGGGLIEELDSEGERNANPDKPDYDALKNAGYYTTEEIVQIHIHKLRKLKTLYQREKELELLIRQQKLRFHRDGLEKLKQFGIRFTTNPYLINKNIDMPKDYIEHQIKEYDAAKAILQTAYKTEGSRGLLRLKMLQKAQELALLAKATGQKHHDSMDMYDSDTDIEDTEGGETRGTRSSSRMLSMMKPVKCAYNEGYAVRACQNFPVYLSNYCFKHILSDASQVQWTACKRRVGPDPQDTCKTPCFKILEKHGCAIHSPLVMSKHKPFKKSEEELNMLAESDNDEEEISLESESLVLANLVSDECVRASHLDEAISKLTMRGPLEQTDTSDSEETDEEGTSNAPATADEGLAHQQNHLF